jgi:hypothetical protein
MYHEDDQSFNTVYTGQYNYRRNEVVSNPIAELSDYVEGPFDTPGTFAYMIRDTGVSDSLFGRALYQGSDACSFNFDENNPNPFADENKYELAQFSSYAPAAGAAVLTVTFEVSVAYVSGNFDDETAGGRNAGYWGLMPEFMYFTFEIDWAQGIPSTYDSDGEFVLNSLEASQQAQLFALTGYRTDNLNTQIADVLNLLNTPALMFVTYRTGEVQSLAP